MASAKVGSVGDEATRLDKEAELAHSSNAILLSELIDILPDQARDFVSEHKEAVRSLARSVAQHALKVATASNLEPGNPKAEGQASVLCPLQMNRRALVVRVVKHGEVLQPGNHLCDQLHALGVQLGGQAFGAGDVAARVRQRAGQACADGVVGKPDDDGNAAGRVLRGECRQSW